VERRVKEFVYEDNNSLLSNYSKGMDTANKTNSKFLIDYPRLFNIVNHQSYEMKNGLLR
jgi:hypothetical protein